MIPNIVVGLMALCLVLALLRFTAELRSMAAENRRLEVIVTRMERATEVVAANLADSVSRADATEGPEGAAADAALRTGDSAAAIHQRQDEAK